MNAVGAENTEFAFVVTAKVDHAPTAFAGTGQSDLVDGSYALLVFVFEHNNRRSLYRG